jgi:hypothetical protein
MMKIESCWLEEVESDNQEWIIPEFICPTLNLWSGQPKMGKSMLVGHALCALAENVDFLGRPTDGESHLFGWMGFDPGWKSELFERWGGRLSQKLRLYPPLRGLNPEDWESLAQTLHQDGVTVFVIDHLYGMAGSLDLNDANEVYKVFNLIRPIYENYGVAVVLLHQAGKSYFSEGRAANSMAIEAEARNLVRIYDKRKPNLRKIKVSGNQGEELDLSIALDPETCEIKSSTVKKVDKFYQRESPQRVSDFLLKANPKELQGGWKGTGRELHRLKLSVSPGAGRTMARSWGDQGLLAKAEGNTVTSGPKLEEWKLSAQIDSQLAGNGGGGVEVWSPPPITS